MPDHLRLFMPVSRCFRIATICFDLVHLDSAIFKGNEGRLTPSAPADVQRLLLLPNAKGSFDTVYEYSNVPLSVAENATETLPSVPEHVMNTSCVLPVGVGTVAIMVFPSLRA